MLSALFLPHDVSSFVVALLPISSRASLFSKTEVVTGRLASVPQCSCLTLSYASPYCYTSCRSSNPSSALPPQRSTDCITASYIQHRLAVGQHMSILSRHDYSYSPAHRCASPEPRAVQFVPPTTTRGNQRRKHPNSSLSQNHTAFSTWEQTAVSLAGRFLDSPRRPAEAARCGRGTTARNLRQQS
jgi:hypothetical protein